jgi:hypothetical protein
LARGRMALERGTTPTLPRRTCSPRYGLHSWRGKIRGRRETASRAHLPPESLCVRFATFTHLRVVARHIRRASQLLLVHGRGHEAAFVDHSVELRQKRDVLRHLPGARSELGVVLHKALHVLDGRDVGVALRLRLPPKAPCVSSAWVEPLATVERWWHPKARRALAHPAGRVSEPAHPNIPWRATGWLILRCYQNSDSRHPASS